MDLIIPRSRWSQDLNLSCFLDRGETFFSDSAATRPRRLLLMEPPSHESHSCDLAMPPPPLVNILPTLLSDKKFPAKWIVGERRQHIYDDEHRFVKKEQSWERRRGDLKAQHFFGLNERNNNKKKKTRLWIMYSCWVCKTEQKAKVSITSSANFLNHQISPFFSFVIIHRGAPTRRHKENDLSTLIYLL